MNSGRTPVPFWIAVAAVVATLVFAWQAAVAPQSGIGARTAFVAWIPKGYAIESVAIGVLIAVVLHPAHVDRRWSIDAAWIGCGALMTLALMSAMTAGGALLPALLLAVVATGVGTRQMKRSIGRPLVDYAVGAIAQAVLMVLVIAAATMFSPRSG